MHVIAAEPIKKVKFHKQKAAVMSLGMAIEALERLLIEKNVLKDDELMEKFKLVCQEHWAKGDNLPPSED